MNSETAVFADASLFMGMHSAVETVRIACKNFFVGRIGKPLSMTLDQVGLCDDVVWRLPRETQDSYYPFMDQLHTLLAADRVGYSRDDIRRANEDPRLAGVDAPWALLLARVSNNHGVLYTVDPALLALPNLPIATVPLSAEKAFPESIERAYGASLVLRLPLSIADMLVMPGTTKGDVCYAG